MSKRAWLWFLVSLLCFSGAYVAWRWGQGQGGGEKGKAVEVPGGVETNGGGQAVLSRGGQGRVERESSAPAGMQPLTSNTPHPGLNAQASTRNSGRGTLNTQQGTSNSNLQTPNSGLGYRLSNTGKGVNELGRSERGIVLENALMDTSGKVELNLPASLRSRATPNSEPGTLNSYLVQARGPVDEAFRKMLAETGAQIISYIPNNAFLVRASEQGAQQLEAQSQAVLAYEPYYKLQGQLLEWAVNEQSLPEGSELNVVLFGDGRQGALEGLQQLGAEVISESPSPFGPVARVRFDSAPTSLLSAVAQLGGVESVELATPRKPSNDLSRVRVGVAADSVTPTNYLNLSGSNVVVEVNDFGVDASHPDLQGRVFGTALTDTSGHGTHVAGIIGSSGGQSATVTNASGSVMPPTNGQFRGMAPAARLFSMPALVTSDFDLQRAAARTNAFISNNSWNYGGTSYDINAASYDAAVRDALPERSGSQPVLFVFSAGDGAGGEDNGLGSSPQSIQSPATAKNGITVGAVELPRGITNEVVDADGATNQVWFGRTDSDNEVAGFSGRGNVGIGIEGDFGRFKPDVVAPGVFVVSTRSGQWDQIAYYNPTNHHLNTFARQTVETNGLNNRSIFVPDNAVRLVITAAVISPAVNLPIYAREGDLAGVGDFKGNNVVTLSPPALTTGTTWFYAIGNPTNVPVFYNVTTDLVTTNDNGNYFEVLSNLNNGLGPFYRYESGTSMSAAEVSGVLALMTDFFTNQLHLAPSPALLKGMLINGARSANVIYDFQVRGVINHQGWGMINLTNSLPAALTNGIASQGSGAPMLLFDQSPTNALATGQRHTVNVNVDTNVQNGPLRVTLVWTDPPGNPAAGIKLVNDLDLIVTNLDTGEIYYGNDIGTGANFTFPTDTNSVPNRDFVNNVENVYLSPPLGTNYAISVIGQRVNVNAVTAQTNNVVQDYALVISAGEGSVSNALVLKQDSGIVSSDARNVTQVDNEFPDNPQNRITGQLLLGQHVGASSPLLGLNTIGLGTNTQWGAGGIITLGVTNQWHFYRMSNTNAFTNAAFATFLPPDLGLPRMGVTNVDDPANATRVEADIDLYVSTNPGLTNLDPAVLASADKSLGRGGTEVIVYTNAVNTTYYIGVKSEDQEAAEYAFFGVFSELPFSTQDADGVLMRGINVPAVVPDGSPAKPGAALVMSIAAQPVTVRRVIVTNIITHEDFGDLLGDLSHSQKFAVLNNHTFGNGQLTQSLIYEDNGENDIPGSRHTDGPGTLRDFVGESGAGVWLLSEVDNALSHTGSVDNVQIRLEPEGDTNGLRLVIAPHSFKYTSVDVPLGATNLLLSVTNLSGTPLPLQLYVRRGDFPTLSTYDYTLTIPNVPSVLPGAILTIDTSDLPPLKPGRYYIGIYNPNDVSQIAQLFVQILPPGGGNANTVDFTAAGASNLLDDAVSYSSITLTNQQKITALNIGVALQHPRISDLVLTLISPTGQRFLLMENRGGNTANAGSTTPATNITQWANSEFETSPAGDYPGGATIEGWTVTSNQVSVVNDPTNANAGSHFLALANGTISRTFSTTPGNKYTLRYAYRGPGIASWWRFEGNVNDAVGGNTGTPVGGPGFIAGEVGQAMSLNGSNAYVSVPAAASLNVGAGPGMTIDAWIKPSDLAQRTFVEWYSGVIQTYFWMSVPTLGGGPGSLFANFVDTTGRSHQISSLPNLLNTNSWQHVACTYDRIGGGIARLYLNGFQVAQANLGIFTPNTSATFYMGYRPPGAGASYSGGMDELSIYGRTLSASELRAIAAAGSGGKFDPAAPAPQNLAEVLVTLNGVQTNSFGSNRNWQTNVITFTAAGTTGTAAIIGLEPGMLIDSITLTEESAQPQYLTFTENTNLAHVPIKYATAPFLSTTTGSIQTLSDFESPLSPSEYLAPGTVPGTGWVVDTNQVSVLRDPTNAKSGSQLLALANARISRTLSTVSGNKYTLSLHYRGPGIVGLWRGENNGVDSVNGNNGNLQSTTFTNGEVGQAFNCLPNGPIVPRVSVPDQQIFKLTNSLSIEGWIRPIGPGYTVFWRGDDRAGFDPYFLSMQGNNNVAFYIEDAGGNAVFVQAPISYNQWWHVAGTLDSTSGVMRLYINGALVNQVVTATRPFGDLVSTLNPRVCIGNVNEHDNFPFAGAIDEISLYSRSLSASEVRAIYSAGSAGKFDPVEFVTSPASSLAKAQVLVAGGSPTVLFGDNNNWQSASFSFTATQSATPVQITGLEPGMLLDNVTLTDQGRGLYYLPEQTLQPLVGQSAQGTWTLEVRDARGLYAGTNVSWQLQFVFETNAPTPISLVNAQPATNTVPPCQMAYYIVDAPNWARYATNVLVSSTVPVQVWFNQNTPPVGNPAQGDFLLISGTTGSATLSTNTVPPLIPGARYYLGVTNSCANNTNASVVLRVDFDTSIITLTNAIAYFNNNSGAFGGVDYYHFVVLNNSVRAQFEINNPSADMQLAVRKGQPPLPSLSTFDYLSANTGTSDELIVAFTNSTPVALSPGDWYLAAINVSSGPVSYSIKATQWAETGQPINVTGTQVVNNGTNLSFCITWQSLIGAHYYVEGITDLGTASWTVVSPTITAADTNTTWCIDLPTPYHFFRVVEGLAPAFSTPPVLPAQLGVSNTSGGFLLQWTGPANATYEVQWTPSLSPANWNTFPGTVTSTTTTYSYLDDGTQTGGLGSQRFYHVNPVP